MAELQTFRNRPGTGFDIPELTSEREIIETGDLLVWIVDTAGNPNLTPIGSPVEYRCVVPPN